MTDNTVYDATFQISNSVNHKAYCMLGFKYNEMCNLSDIRIISVISSTEGSVSRFIEENLNVD